MDSFELNKIIGAILGTLLFVMGVGFLAEAIYHPAAAGPGYALPAPEEGEGDSGAPDAPAVSIGTLLASADPAAGEASAKKCQACHDLSSASTNKTGPGLYDVVERVIGSHPGFGYSPTLLEYNAKGEVWTYEHLNQFLTSPKAAMPGTKMTFAGVKDDKERANIIAFLSTLSASPKPFPPADAPESDTTVAPGDHPVDGAVSAAPADVVATPSTTDVPSAETAPASSEAPTMSAAPMSAESAMQPASSEASSAAQ